MKTAATIGATALVVAALRATHLTQTPCQKVARTAAAARMFVSAVVPKRTPVLVLCLLARAIPRGCVQRFACTANTALLKRFQKSSFALMAYASML
jgi:hypothetical protein